MLAGHSSSSAGPRQSGFCNKQTQIHQTNRLSTCKTPANIPKSKQLNECVIISLYSQRFAYVCPDALKTAEWSRTKRATFRCTHVRSFFGRRNTSRATERNACAVFLLFANNVLFGFLRRDLWEQVATHHTQQMRNSQYMKNEKLHA